MRPHRRTEQVESAVRIGDPIAQRLVDGGAQCLVATRHRHHFGAHQAHTTDIGRLALHVDRAHVDRTGQAETRTGRRTRHAMLAGAGLGDDTLGTEALGKQRLTEGVVDLVRARVREVLALEPDFGTPSCREPRRMRQRGRAADPGIELPGELSPEILSR